MAEANEVMRGTKPKRQLSGRLKGLFRPGALNADVGRGAFQRDYRAVAQGPGEVTFDDYLAYRLHDRALFPRDIDRLRFVSAAAHDALCRRCMDRHWGSLLEDRWMRDTMLGQSGIATPRTVAVVNSGSRVFGGLPRLDDAAMLDAFLKQHPAPVIARTDQTQRAETAIRIASLGNGRYNVENLGIVCIQALFAYLGDAGSPWLLQNEMEPHPGIVALFGTRAGDVGVKAVNFVVDGRVHTPVFILIVKDCFQGMNAALGDLDEESGTICSLIAGWGETCRVIDTLPGASSILHGEALPDWPRVREMVTEAGAVFAPAPYHCVDIAITKTGPVVTGAAVGAPVEMVQQARGAGFLTDETISFLNACGAGLSMPGTEKA